MLKNSKRKGMLKIIAPILVVLAGISISWAIVVHRPPLKSQISESEVPLVQVIQVEPQTVKVIQDTSIRGTTGVSSVTVVHATTSNGDLAVMQQRP